MVTPDRNLTRHDWHGSSDTDLAATLASVPLFAKLGRRRVRKTARNGELASFVPGDVVVRGDEPADFFYVVLRGEAELRDDGKTRRLRPGDYFGEASLLRASNRSLTVVATDDLHVLRLPGPVFLRLAQQSPSIAFAILRQLGRQVRKGDQRLISRAA